jgi:glycosyltransferase involved in cell wall biosynthesis
MSPSPSSSDVPPLEAPAPVVVPLPPVAVTPPARPASTSALGDSDLLEARLTELEQLAADLHALDGGLDETPVRLNVPADFRLSIVVPVYNEKATIRAILAKLMQLDLPTEIIVVDDGSTDGTRDELQRLIGLPGLQVVLKPSNEGKGAALRTGFQHVTGSTVLVQDADLEYDPRDIPRLLEPLLAGQADVVYGSRFLEQRWSGSSRIHRLGNRLLTIASNLTTGLRLTDMETCYKVFRAEVLNRLTVRQDRFGFEPEVTAKLARRGLRFCEVPIRYHARDWDEGKKIGVRDAVNALFCIVRYAWAD